MPYISIAIPTHEMHGKGPAFLKKNFDVLLDQTFKDFNVIISDNAQTDVIKSVCDTYANRLNIIYIQNPDAAKRMSSNVNNAIAHATGTLIKILFLDDFLYGNDSLEKIVHAFDITKDTWLAAGCIHTHDGQIFDRPHTPRWNSLIYLGKNTIGSPSVITIKNGIAPTFEENLMWLMDCDYYEQCFKKYGPPKCIPDKTVAIRIGDHQTTNNEATQKMRQNEYRYILKKYDRGLRYALLYFLGLLRF